MCKIISYEEIQEKVISIQEQQVLVDRDVAELYGVITKEINKAVKNNPDKFPEGYIITLSSKEKTELVKNFHRFNSLKHSTVLPSAFTEKGLYMLATILKSPNATQTTIAIVETFAKIHELSKIINQLPDIQKENKKKTLLQRSGEILSEILDSKAMDVSGDETTIEINLAVDESQTHYQARPSGPPLSCNFFGKQYLDIRYNVCKDKQQDKYTLGEMLKMSEETTIIEKGAAVLNTYRVESDAIEGGMGKVWRVHHTGWDTDLALKQPKAQR